MTVPQTGLGVIRYTLVERVVHAAASVSYVYLLLTGLALWSPGLYWLAVVLGGGFVSRALHPWIGLAFSVAVVWMVAAWQRDMRTTEADKAWRRALPAYIRNEDDKVPPAGRFNFGQKQFFWAMAWSAAALLISGVVLWFPQSVPEALHALRPIAVFVHAAASLVTIAAFIIHVYMGVFVVPGGVRAVTKGDVTASWARHHHALWAADSGSDAALGRDGQSRR